MTLKKKVALVFLAPILFLLIFVSNFSGICWTEFKKYSEEELIKKAASKSYAENPSCCEIISHNYYGIDDEILNKLFGRYIYGLNAYFKTDPRENDTNYPYRNKVYAINQCGEHIAFSYGEGIKEKEYLKEINRIKSKKKEINND
ncbi:MAG: hypothetical protein O2970_07085 [Proteobacteria bacterium]|nr:hypothetical protein [Pseudomonadota bacterium]MDA0966705.1 hypothetical protein [Pseudomonadota bacterium]